MKDEYKSSRSKSALIDCSQLRNSNPEVCL